MRIEFPLDIEPRFLGEAETLVDLVWTTIGETLAPGPPYDSLDGDLEHHAGLGALDRHRTTQSVAVVCAPNPSVRTETPSQGGARCHPGPMV